MMVSHEVKSLVEPAWRVARGRSDFTAMLYTYVYIYIWNYVHNRMYNRHVHCYITIYIIITIIYDLMNNRIYLHSLGTRLQVIVCSRREKND